MSLYEVNCHFMFVHVILFLCMQNTMLDFVNMAFTNCMLTMSVLMQALHHLVYIIRCAGS